MRFSSCRTLTRSVSTFNAAVQRNTPIDTKLKLYLSTVRTSYDPSNTRALFASKSIWQLLFEASLFKLCSIKPLVQSTSYILQSDVFAISPLVRYAVRHTVFRHFVSGETMEDCMTISKQLFNFARVSTILDHNIEEKETAAHWELNLANKLAHFKKISTYPHSNVKFVPIKCTALMCPKMLEEITRLIEFKCGSPDEQERVVASELSVSTLELLESGVERLRAICNAAQEAKVSLLLDAEQTGRQPAIELIARRLSAVYNIEHCLLYNTYQCYLTRSEEAVHRDMEHALRCGYIFGVKLVRGAYMKTERGAAFVKSGLSDPIYPSKNETDANYDRVLSRLISHVPQASVALMIATHNRTSIDKAVDQMNKLHIDPAAPLVSFGCIMGMADHLSSALGLAGYNSCKLVSFGVYEDVLPWLCRRLDENADVFGAMQSERHLYMREVKRRLKTAAALTS